MVERAHSRLNLSKQCKILHVSRSAFYYRPNTMSKADLDLLNKIDEIYTKFPYYGSRKIKAELIRQGYSVGRHKVRKFMRLLGLEAICPKRNLSKPNKEHKIYPYLLKGMEIIRPNQVWSTDITYIRMRHGFVYLVAVIDWYSRYVLSWRISTTLDTDFCIEALREALTKGIPEYFNTDQGSQFTSDKFTDILKSHCIKISMDGKGRASDNIFVERLWRSVKYEEVYLKSYESVLDCKINLRNYFDQYNNERLHQSLDYVTPAEIHYAIMLSRKAG